MNNKRVLLFKLHFNFIFSNAAAVSLRIHMLLIIMYNYIIYKLPPVVITGVNDKLCKLYPYTSDAVLKFIHIYGTQNVSTITNFKTNIGQFRICRPPIIFYTFSVTLF